MRQGGACVEGLRVCVCVRWVRVVCCDPSFVPSLPSLTALFSPSTDKFVKGCYAVSVTGRLPSGIIAELRRNGKQYRSRDSSLKP